MDVRWAGQARHDPPVLTLALVSTYRRLGEPVVVACGPSEASSGGLRVGLLFVAPGLNLSRVTLRPIDDPQGRRTTVIWPSNLNQLPEAKCLTSVTLEVA